MKKFELEDLPRSAVVNSGSFSYSSDVDEIINNVVVNHLSSIVEDSEDEFNELDNKKKIDESEENSNISSTADQISKKGFLNLDELQEDAFLRGKDEAKTEYDKKLKELHSEQKLFDLLKSKLEDIAPVEKLDSQIAKVSAEAISSIAKKLHLILPVNFEEIIVSGLLSKLKSFYKKGNITITVHPKRYDFCKEILQSDKISSKFKDNFQIVQNNNMNEDDCSVEWLDTRLEYNKEQISAEIEKIIKQLQSAM